MGSGRRTTEAKCPHSILLRACAAPRLFIVGVDVDHWTEGCLSSFSAVQLLSSPTPSIVCSLERRHQAWYPLMEWGVMLQSTYCKVEHLHTPIVAVLHGRFVSSSPFINLVNHVISMDSWIFILYFGLQSNTDSPQLNNGLTYDFLSLQWCQSIQ